MAAPDGNSVNGSGGMLNGHGIAIAMVAIIVGMALVVGFAASDGAMFGLNFSSSSDNNAPVIDSDAGGAGAISRDAFDEGSGGESIPQSGAGSNVSSVQPARSATLSEEERQLLAMRNFSWDSIAVQYIASSQDIIDKFNQQNFTRQKPAQPGIEPIHLSDRIIVDVDRDSDRDREDNSDSGSGSGDDQSGESDSGDSGSNSTDTNSTGTDTNSTGTDTNSTGTEDFGSSDGGSDSSGDGLSVEVSISIG